MGDFKDPTALLEKRWGISPVLEACPISDVLITSILADEEPLCGNAAIIIIIIIIIITTTTTIIIITIIIIIIIIIIIMHVSLCVFIKVMLYWDQPGWVGWVFHVFYWESTVFGWFSWSAFSTHSEPGWIGWKQWVSTAITIVGSYLLHL